MKKLLLLLFAFAFTFAAQAQPTFGIRAGVNLSNLSGDLVDDSRFNNKVGWHAGVIANFAITENFFSVQPELFYNNIGFKNEEEEFELDNLTIRREGSVNFNYLTLPLLAKINAGPLYFEVGPQASYLLSVRNNTDTFIAGVPAPGVDRNTTDNFTRFELGYMAGIGIGMPQGVSVGVRYASSFSDFTSDDAPEDFFEGDLENARHSVFMFTVGYTLPTRR